MRTNYQDFLKVHAAIILCAGCSSVLGAGFNLPDQDAFATARGEAFAATADNPSAIFYNPAGIAQLTGGNLRGGLYGIYLDPSYTSPTTGNSYDNENKLHAIPQVFYTYGHENWPVSFGLGVYSPFGMGLEWPDGTGFRTATGGLESSLTYMTFNPVIAFKLAPNLFIGGGVSANYAYAHLKQGLTGNPGDYLEFKGDGWAVGYNFGALWQPCDELSFGGTFRSGTTANLQGHTLATYPGFPAYTSAASSEFNFPYETVLGVSYRPTPKWNLEFDAEYSDWGCVQSVDIMQATPSPLVSLSSLSIPLDWDSSWYFEWGGTRYFDNGWHASAGYIFNENSVPDANYAPAVTDLNKHFFSIGTGYKGEHLNFDIAYQFGYGPTRTVSGATGGSASANGQYNFISHAVLISAGWHF